MFAVPLPVFFVRLTHRNIVFKNDQVLRVLELRRMREVVAARHYRAICVTRIDHHDFIVRRHVLVIEHDWDLCRGEATDHAGLDPFRLLWVGNHDDGNATAVRLNERVRNIAVREAERLHQNLPLRTLDRVHDQRVGGVARSERNRDFAGRDEILSGGRLESERTRRDDREQKNSRIELFHYEAILLQLRALQTGSCLIRQRELSQRAGA
jgi:hypothetical protein